MNGLVSLFLLFFFATSAVAQNNNANTSTNSVLLDVPFVVQSPFSDWTWPWEDFCEEASVVMSYRYTQYLPVSKTIAAREMLRLANFELKTFGYDKDTGVKDTERMIREYYRYPNTHILENPTVDGIKMELQKGNLVLVPVAGKLLKNPHFVPPGPRYHMEVIRGFSGNDFIVNEPGTVYGEGYHYSITTLMTAMHDLVPGNILTGPKRVLVVEKS